MLRLRLAHEPFVSGKRLQARGAPNPRAIGDGHFVDERVDLGERPMGGDEQLLVLGRAAARSRD